MALGILLVTDEVLVTRPIPGRVSQDDVAAMVHSAPSSQVPLSPNPVEAGPTVGAGNPAPSLEPTLPLDQATATPPKARSPTAPSSEGERFTIQLLTVNSDAHLSSFAERNGLAGQLRVLRGHRRGREWYAILLGDYATRDQAEATLADLPARLRRSKPLVRVMPFRSQPWPSP